MANTIPLNVFLAILKYGFFSWYYVCDLRMYNKDSYAGLASFFVLSSLI